MIDRSGEPRAEVPLIREPSQLMRAAGIVQRGDQILRTKATEFRLPAESRKADEILKRLHDTVRRITRIHTFSKGVGVAAPQIGIGCAAALVVLPNGDQVTLLNPRIVEESSESDARYEGCLSFFDVRGKAQCPLTIWVEHTDVQGRKHCTRFDKGAARLVKHEIDHLQGRLYTDRMAQGDETIPVEEYRGTGRGWEYPSDQSPLDQ